MTRGRYVSGADIVRVNKQHQADQARIEVLTAAITRALHGCALCRIGCCRADAHLWLSEALNDGVRRHTDQREGQP